MTIASSNHRPTSAGMRVIMALGATLAVVLAGAPPAAQVAANPDSGARQLVEGPNQAATVIRINSTPNPAVWGQVVTITAMVTATAGMPAGAVAFYDAGVLLGSRPLDANRTAALSLAGLVTGTHPITATYVGAAGYAASTSALRIQAVWGRPSVSMGNRAACKLRSDGTIACWGNPSMYVEVLTVPDPNTDWVQLDTGADLACGLKADGTAVCWGAWYGIEVPAPNADWVQVSAGWFLSCGLKSDSRIVCWGSDSGYQVPNPNVNWVRVDVGDNYACGIRIDGTMQCWGMGSYGQTMVPEPNENWIQSDSSSSDTCGLKRDRTLVCWGLNDYGQNVVPAPNADWIQVDLGLGSICGLRRDHTLKCWGGDPNHPLLGQVPVPQPNTDWIGMDVAKLSACGLKASGQLICWGWNYYEQAPILTISREPSPNAAIGFRYERTLTAQGGTNPPFRFSVMWGTLPPGLTFSSTGTNIATLSGVPLNTGLYTFTVRVEDANGMIGTRGYTVAVESVAFPVSASPGILAANGISATLIAFTPTVSGQLVVGSLVELNASPGEARFDRAGGPSRVTLNVGASGVVTRWLVAGNTAPITTTVTATVNAPRVGYLSKPIPVRLVRPDGLSGHLGAAFDGDVLTYTWAVTHFGPQPALDVVITFTLPDNAVVVGTPTGGTRVGGSLIYSATQMAVGEAHEMGFVVAPLLRFGDMVVSAEASSSYGRLVGVGRTVIYRAYFMHAGRR